MKKGVSVPPSVDCALLTVNTAMWRWPSQSSLRQLATARNVSLRMPFARSTFALVFLWYAEPTMKHEPMPLAKARNTAAALVNLQSDRGPLRARHEDALIFIALSLLSVLFES
jgi:hypothetical protein